MTEEEWLNAASPLAMLPCLVGPSERKLRLFAVACCHRIGLLIEHPDSIRAVEVAGRYAEGCSTADELRDACRAADAHFTTTCVYGTSTGDQAARAAVAASADAGDMIRLHCLSFRMFGDEDLAANANLLRDIFPFHPITIDPRWLTTTVLSLAKGMYESRDFSAMPILADALQDAGCDNDDILAHCRDAAQVHVRGCWVVDLVLARE